jgi:hypothetical protein
MGTIGQLFPLTDNTGGAVVYQVQQQHLFVSKLHRYENPLAKSGDALDISVGEAMETVTDKIGTRR